jgi:hypothetical protein
MRLILLIAILGISGCALHDCGFGFEATEDEEPTATWGCSF